jgi:RNA polymerase sigma factor (sigma-70 family)
VHTFAKEVEATIPALRRYARALTRSSDISDDLVQDAVVRTLCSEYLFRGGELRSWLYTILNNLHRNRLRSLARRPPMSPLEVNDTPDLTGSESVCRDIEHALATLLEDERNALLLVVLEGLTYHEVAEVQGVPIGTVMSRLARARADQKLSRRRAPSAAKIEGEAACRLIGGVPVRCREIEYVFAIALVAQARQQFWPDDGYGIKMRGKGQSQTNRDARRSANSVKMVRAVEGRSVDDAEPEAQRQAAVAT